jgi:hypothetical protein
MKNIDGMTALGKLIRQPVDVHAITAEVIRRIERGDHAKFQRLIHD